MTWAVIVYNIYWFRISGTTFQGHGQSHTVKKWVLSLIHRKIEISVR